MGLTRKKKITMSIFKEFKAFRQNKAFKERFGINIEEFNTLIKNVSVLSQKVDEINNCLNNLLQQKQNKSVNNVDTQQKEIKNTPQDFISQFAGQVEEFYPYGKPKGNN